MLLTRLPIQYQDQQRGTANDLFKKRYPIFFDNRGFLESRPWPLPNLERSSFYDLYWYRSSHDFDFGGHIFDCEHEGKKYHAFLHCIDHGHRGMGGFVVLWHYSYPTATEPLVFSWQQCKHEFVQKTLGNCYNRYTCKHCQHAYDVDSSD